LQRNESEEGNGVYLFILNRWRLPRERAADSYHMGAQARATTKSVSSSPTTHSNPTSKSLLPGDSKVSLSPFSLPLLSASHFFLMLLLNRIFGTLQGTWRPPRVRQGIRDPHLGQHRTPLLRGRQPFPHLTRIWHPGGPLRCCPRGCVLVDQGPRAHGAG
jgi:hypothetical protein